jgi:glycosyltransferase involved in cell wall biosynthesis
MIRDEYYYNHSGDLEELEFMLEIFSILQIDFLIPSRLVVFGAKDLSHFANKFKWINPPILAQKETNDSLSFPKHLKNNSGLSTYLRTAKAYSCAKYIKENDAKEEDENILETIYIIFSDEIFEWKSLQEATEAIVGFWYRQCTARICVEVLNIKKNSNLSEFKKIFVEANRVVVAKISPTIGQFFKRLRIFNPDCAFVIYGFESSSIYFANTNLYELEQYFYREDLWIMSCESDEWLAHKAWENIKTKVIPLKQLDHHKVIIKNNPKHLLYVGRISEQKNLEDLIFSVYLLAKKMRNEGRKLKIFGEEDFLGVPNLGIESQGYLKRLHHLIQKLGVSDIVEIGRYLNHQEIDEELKNSILISTSVHSDENFGLVVFRALNLGVPVLISFWGGHKDFKNYFDGVRYFKVYKSDKGPRTNPYEIAQGIEEIWKKIPEITFKKNEIDEIQFITGKKPLCPRPLKQNFLKKIRERKPHQKFVQWPFYGVLFENYEMDEYLSTLDAYGAHPLSDLSPETSVIAWRVEFTNEEIRVFDCRVGELRYSREKHYSKIKVYQFAKGLVELSKAEWGWLVQNGQVFLRGNDEL